jgi:predicted transcriptional regulator
VKNRSKIEILNKILESARGGTTKTRIMYDALLSYRQLLEYMKILQESELLKYEEGKQHYHITEKGLKFLATSNEINELLSPKTSGYPYLRIEV